MDKVIVIGGGGHARSVIDIILQRHMYEVVGCLDVSYPARKSIEYMEDIPIIGNDNMIPELNMIGIKHVFVALGDNQIRCELIKKVKEHHLKLINVISSNAYISSRVIMGEGICAMAGAIINVNCQIGDGTIINTNASIDHDCIIGSFVHIAPGTVVSGTTMIGNGTHVGTSAGVIDGINVGEWSYIGAGSVVVSDIPSNVMAYGVPAKIIRMLK